MSREELLYRHTRGGFAFAAGLLDVLRPSWLPGKTLPEPQIASTSARICPGVRPLRDTSISPASEEYGSCGISGEALLLVQGVARCSERVGPLPQ